MQTDYIPRAVRALRGDRLIFSALLMSLMFLAPCHAQPGPAEKRAVAEALTAIEGCYHWAGESGEGDGQRTDEIATQSVHYCSLAQEKAEAAYKRYPKNGELAAGILQLLYISYFDTSAEKTKRICDAAAAYFKAEYLGTHEEGDGSFRNQCPAQAKALYGAATRSGR